MDITRYCDPAEINWSTLKSLPTLFGPDDEGEITRIKAELDRYPDKVTYSNLDAAIDDVRMHGPPKRWSLFIKYRRTDISIPSRPDVYIAGSSDSVYVSLDRAKATSQMDTLIEFLGLHASAPSRLAPGRPRTAFIAHRFDEVGSALAGKLARLLELLDFEVSTGRAYSPGSVAEKVRGRLERQELLFVIRTQGTDDTWLIQESVLGQVTGKPLIILKDLQAEFTAGLLADHEYIPFESPAIESTFLPILEGLRDLGYSLSAPFGASTRLP